MNSRLCVRQWRTVGDPTPCRHRKSLCGLCRVQPQIRPALYGGQPESWRGPTCKSSPLHTTGYSSRRRSRRTQAGHGGGFCLGSVGRGYNRLYEPWCYPRDGKGNRTGNTGRSNGGVQNPRRPPDAPAEHPHERLAPLRLLCLPRLTTCSPCAAYRDTHHA